MAHPGACGFPDASTAGAHGTLSAYTGSLVFSTTGQILQNVSINGCPLITARNVIFRNVSVFCNSRQSYMVETEGAADTGGLTIMEHVTMVCGPNVHGGTAFGDEFLVVTAADISHCENGGDANNVFTLQESYIHDMFKGDSVAPDPHTDGIQVWPGATNIKFLHNTVLMHNDNAAFTSGSPGPTQAHLAIERNLMDGGSYTVYCSNNVGTLKDNRFGPLGPNHTAPWEHADSCQNMTRSGNVLDTDNSPLSGLD